MHPPPARRAGRGLGQRPDQLANHSAHVADRQVRWSRAAAVEISGPGLTGSSRNTRAVISSSCPHDSSNAATTDGALVPLPSSYLSVSKRRISSASSSAISATVRNGSAFSSAAVICRASGSPPQIPARRTAPGWSHRCGDHPGGRSAAPRQKRYPRPLIQDRYVQQPGPSPVRVHREVTTTRCGQGAGSSSRTCASEEALSAMDQHRVADLGQHRPVQPGPILDTRRDVLSWES